LQTSHVLAALIRRFHEAKQSSAKTVTLWGTGAACREFLHSDDMAAACVHLMTLPDPRAQSIFNDREPPLVNVGCGEDLPIRDLTELVRRVVDVDTGIEWDTSKPDGTPRKLLDVRKLAALGWRANIGLEDGIRRVYAGYRTQQG
jgi:GDP-L-fucose synthase